MTPPYVPPRRTWRTKLRESVTERLGLKVIALLLAVLLWLVVHTRRPAAGDVAGRVAPLLDAPQRVQPRTPRVSERPVVAPASDSTVSATP